MVTDGVGARVSDGPMHLHSEAPINGTKHARTCSVMGAVSSGTGALDAGVFGVLEEAVVGFGAGALLALHASVRMRVSVCVCVWVCVGVRA